MTARQTWRPKLQHLAAAIAGVAVFALVFAYTGDSDLLFAVTSGAIGSLSFYLVAQFRLFTRERK